MANTDPNPKKKILKADPYSWMRFMREELKYDSESEKLIRFRGQFVMPKWDGVEDNEVDYEVDDPLIRTDQLAVRFWGAGRERLWWVIAARNNMDIPGAQMYKGRKIKIPTWQWVNDVLLPQFRDVEGGRL